MRNVFKERDNLVIWIYRQNIQKMRKKSKRKSKFTILTWQVVGKYCVVIAVYLHEFEAIFRLIDEWCLLTPVIDLLGQVLADEVFAIVTSIAYILVTFHDIFEVGCFLLHNVVFCNN